MNKYKYYIIKNAYIFLKINMGNINFLQKRLQKELLAIQKEPPPGVRVNPETVGPSLTQ